VVSKLVKVEKGKSHGRAACERFPCRKGRTVWYLSRPWFTSIQLRQLVHVLAAGEVERALFPGRIVCKDVLRGVNVSVAVPDDSQKTWQWLHQRTSRNATCGGGVERRGRRRVGVYRRRF
jgi:hypothetical protein